MQLNMKERKTNLSIRRIGLCWEATRAPRWTRKPQAWAICIAQAGLLRARPQSEKSIVKQTKKQTGIVSYASTAKGTFTLNQNTLTEPSQRTGKRCSPKDHERIKRLEVRPPAAVSIGTPSNGRGRTGSATHGSFSLFPMVLKRRVNNRQTKVTLTADRENPSYFLRSVV